MLVVKQRAMQAEDAGARRIDQTRGIIRAHLEDDAHLEFADHFSAHESADAVECVDRDQNVNAVTASFANQLAELCAGICPAISATGKIEVVFVPKFFEPVQSVDEKIDRGGLGG